MIGFLLVLLQSYVFASTTAPGCPELSRILNSAEKDLMSSHAKSCQELDITTILPPESSTEVQSFFNDNKCSPLHQIETQIAELENQEALLLGFEKLKNQVSTTQETISTEKSEEELKKATQEFAQALNTAQSIEVMLDSTLPGKDKNFLQSLAAEKPEDWSSLEKFKSLTAEFCQKITDAKNLRVCSSDFTPNEQTHKELRELLRTQGLSDEEAQQWKRSLSIQKADGSTYSFVSMAEEIKESYTKLLNGEALSPEELESIKALDKFRSNPHFSFAQKLPAPKGDALIPSKIKSHFLSLKRRQEVEMNSKMSVVASLSDELLNGEEKSACHGFNLNDQFGEKCFNALKTAYERVKTSRTDDQTSQLSEALSAFSRSRNYIKSLDEIAAKCESNLSECAINLPVDLAKITDQLSALRVIKEEIGKEQELNMKFRNFALIKFVNNCQDNTQTSKSIVEECNETLSLIAPEVFKLSSNLMSISLTVNPKQLPEDDEEVKALCENEDVKKLTDQRKLCAFFKDKPSDEIPVKKPRTNPDTYRASVQAPKGSNPTREAWLQGLAAIANATADAWIANNNGSYWGNTINPYAYNYGPYNATGAMSTADSILFNARYYGAYGYYLPTMGLQPYTTFGSGSITSYSALPRSSSAYSYFAR